MRRFTQLFDELDATTRTNEKVDALARYFVEAKPANATWALYFLLGNRFRRLVSTRNLRTWAAEAAGLPTWIIGECWDSVGDLSETLALVLPEPAETTDLPLRAVVEERIEPLTRVGAEEARRIVERTWRELASRERLVYHKLLLGNFRLGVAKRLVTRAFAEAAGVEPAVMAHRLLGRWEPTAAHYSRLISGEAGPSDVARPYPFFLAHALQEPVETLGDPAAWLLEWKWDGIRAQVIRRGDATVVWSRGEELIDHQFPEIKLAAERLPSGTVLDGEIVAWEDDRPLPFASLQRRLNRKRVEPSLFPEVPVRFVAFDLLEAAGEDAREEPLVERRRRLRAAVEPLDDPAIGVSPTVDVESWADARSWYERAREVGAEGLMFKRLDSPYGVGRPRGPWWKWKVEPHSVDAVLIHAQLGTGKRASLFTDYTFGVWDGDKLVPIAKAYSGLTDEEIRRVDRFVERNTVAKHGPVRVVKPELVFELGFEGIRESGRHKAGLALRFPRILRWRQDKRPEEADRIRTLRELATAVREGWA